jgi:hypothetical protein
MKGSRSTANQRKNILRKSVMVSSTLLDQLKIEFLKPTEEQVMMLLEAVLFWQNNPDKLPYYRVEDGTIGFKDKPADPLAKHNE